jgi:hypothetical protein
MGNGAMAKGPKLPRPSSTLPKPSSVLRIGEPSGTSIVGRRRLPRREGARRRSGQPPSFGTTRRVGAEKSTRGPAATTPVGLMVRWLP